MEPLAKIFGSPARLKILRLFLFNQNTSFILATIATRTKLSADAVRDELSDLLDSGLIRKKGARATASYQVNSRFEHLEALDTFIRETTNVRPQDIVSAVKRSGNVRLVVLSGLFTGQVESQIDLLIAGDNLEDRTLASVVRSLEAELGREIRYASFGTADFRYRRGVYDRLLRDVFDYPHRVLLDKLGL
jgi:hypothetical protein